jgi:diacylglycerol kinase (ATP)
MPTTIILNPHARQGHAALLEPLIKAFLLEHRMDADVVLCATPESLTEVFAKLGKGSRVIGIGGDGTNHRLLPYLLAGNHEYGLVPYGSGDDVARAVGLFGTAWQEALLHALTAPAQPIDVATARDVASGNERPFFGCFLFGMDGHINNQTSTWKFKGPIPYFLTLLKELPKLRGWNLKVQWATKDGQSYCGDLGYQILCSVLNTPTYGSGYPIAPMARMNDGVLNLMQAPMVGRWRFLDLFFKMLKGKHVDTPYVRMDEVVSVTIESPEPLCLSADGEVLDWSSRHITIQVQAGALLMVTGVIL